MAATAKAIIDRYAKLCSDLQARVIYLEAELEALAGRAAESASEASGGDAEPA